GMRDSRIVNNTVIDNNNATPGPPWIMVTPHKNGTPSQNVLIRNNLATDYDLSGTAIVQDHNTTLTNNLAQFFVSPANFDLHLLANAPAVDTGSPDQAPPLDRDRVARPQGKGVDLGAYEWHTAAAGAAGTSGSGGGSGTGGVAGSSGSAGRAGASGSGQGGAAGASG